MILSFTINSRSSFKKSLATKAEIKITTRQGSCREILFKDVLLYQVQVFSLMVIILCKWKRYTPNGLQSIMFKIFSFSMSLITKRLKLHLMETRVQFYKIHLLPRQNLFPFKFHLCPSTDLMFLTVSQFSKHSQSTLNACRTLIL